MNIDSNWSTDWQTFVGQLVDLLDQDKSDKEISELFREQPVQWQGKITKVLLDAEFAPGISMSMGVLAHPMGNEKTFKADHISLLINPEENETWLDSQVGDEVCFTAVIPKSETKAAEIRFFESPTKPLVSLRMTLKKCKRL